MGSKSIFGRACLRVVLQSLLEFRDTTFMNKGYGVVLLDGNTKGEQVEKFQRILMWKISRTRLIDCKWDQLVEYIVGT